MNDHVSLFSNAGEFFEKWISYLLLRSGVNSTLPCNIGNVCRQADSASHIILERQLQNNALWDVTRPGHGTCCCLSLRITQTFPATRLPDHRPVMGVGWIKLAH